MASILCLLPFFFPSISAVQFPIMDVPQLIEYWGYPVENHWVETADGYILNIHRIPSAEADSPVVLLQHGLFGSSARFAAGPPQQSLAYILSDLKYDVWLGNTRGNTYSRNHSSLDPDDDQRAFWSFDWDVAAMGDLPATVDYVRRQTGGGDRKLFFLGHSMGSTEFLVAASERPEIQDHLLAAFLLAPPAWFAGHADDGVLAALSREWRAIEDALALLGVWEVLPDTNLTSAIGHDTCDDVHFAENEAACLSYADVFCVTSRAQLNTSMLPVYFDAFPEGSSVKPLIHYGQLINSSDHFRKYDYGSAAANVAHYGVPEPPEYDLGRVLLPVFLFYGDGDTLVRPEDVLRLSAELPNAQLTYRVPFAGWTHGDFVYAVDAPELLYDVIIQKMEEINAGEDYFYSCIG